MATMKEPQHNKIEPTKCSLRYKPPVLIIFYNDLITGKKRRRSMPLRNFTSQTNVSEYATSLYNHVRHKPYISSVKRGQLESLLERVRKAQGVNDTYQTGDLTLDESITLQRQLLPPVTNKVGAATRTKNDIKLLDFDDELERILMGDVSKDDDKTNESDDEVTNAASNAMAHKTTKKIPQSKQGSLPPLPPISKPSSVVFPNALDEHKLLPQKHDSKPTDEGDYSLSKEPLSELEEEIDELTDTSLSDNDTPLMTSDHLKLIDTTKMISSDDEDYNKMPEGEYSRKKAEMDQQFELERTKPTDSNFVYDKEEEYDKPIMESGWDSDSSSSSEF